MKYLLPLLLIFFACEQKKKTVYGISVRTTAKEYSYEMDVMIDDTLYHEKFSRYKVGYIQEYGSGDDYLEYYSYYDSLTGEVVHGNNWNSDHPRTVVVVQQYDSIIDYYIIQSDTVYLNSHPTQYGDVHTFKLK